MTDTPTPVATIPQILDAVGDDPGLAQAALADELERGEKARTSLVDSLRRVVEDPASGRRFVFVDGGVEALPVPSGKTVAVVTDRTTGRVLDPDGYEAGSDGVVKTAGGSWAPGPARWALDFEA